jgi:hypothetical protein
MIHPLLSSNLNYGACRTTCSLLSTAAVSLLKPYPAGTVMLLVVGISIKPYREGVYYRVVSARGVGVRVRVVCVCVCVRVRVRVCVWCCCVWNFLTKAYSIIIIIITTTAN